MKPEDFPEFTFLDRQLLLVPELPVVDDNHSCCDFCFNAHDDFDCNDVNKAAHGEPLNGNWCGDKDTVYLEKSRFEEYVVEFVRRRVGQ